MALPRVCKPEQQAHSVVHCGQLWRSPALDAGVACWGLLLSILRQSPLWVEQVLPMGSLPLERLEVPTVRQQELCSSQGVPHALVPASTGLELPKLW